MAVVDDNFGPGIEPVDQVASPGIKAEHRFVSAVTGDEVNSLYREALRVKVRVDQLAVADLALLGADPNPENNGAQRPEMAGQPGFEEIHAGRPCLQSCQAIFQSQRQLSVIAAFATSLRKNRSDEHDQQ